MINLLYIDNIAAGMVMGIDNTIGNGEEAYMSSFHEQDLILELVSELLRVPLPVFVLQMR